MKQLPVSVRCFQACDLETPVKNELLTFVEISGDTADILSMQVMKAISNYDKVYIHRTINNTTTQAG
jgi:hypothetical protein